MKVKLNIDKIISEVNKIKIPYITNVIAFLSSFNFWYLNLYFFKPYFLEKHGIIITLMTTFSITIAWFLINTISSFKDAIYTSYKMGINKNIEEILVNRKSITLLIFFNIILTHSLFFYFAYIFELKFIVFISLIFAFISLKYLLVDSLLNRAYRKKLV
jgi:hypothetical protein